MSRKLVWLLCSLAFAACSYVPKTLPVVAPLGEAKKTEYPNADRNAGYRELYRFPGGDSGSEPTGLIEYKGALYGTTLGGGAKTFGTVFVSGAGGKARVLYSFQGGDDGAEPEGTLVVLGGSLYGTTQYGGENGDGTVFAITPAGKEHVVYAFKGGSDGANPVLGGLTPVDGKLYGTTYAGGDQRCRVQNVVGCGIVFAVTSTGSETVLHRFAGRPDGALPSGALLWVRHALYGTTNYGGKYNNGTVFAITTAGKRRAVYDFKGYPDGATPYAGLTPLGGMLYGTTALGGAFNGSGTVFELSANGTERVLHSFKGAPDGALPYAALTAVGSTLYGTTELGGSSKPACESHGIVGCGTLFSIDSSGNLSVIYRFKGHADGASPWASLVDGGRTLYGTTLLGGLKNNGTIFGIAP